jgi:hypothetical protein
MDKTVSGVVGFFPGPEELLQAMRRLREQNYELFDAYSPFPIHGMDDAQGLKPSPVPYVTFLGGAAGFTAAVGLTMYTSGIDWPIIVGGKEFFSWQAFVPVWFELTVLLAALSTFVAMILLNRLPNVNEKAFDPAITSDRFALWIGAPPPMPSGDDVDEEEVEKWKKKRAPYKPFDPSEAANFLKSIGATEVKTVMNEGWF